MNLAPLAPLWVILPLTALVIGACWWAARRGGRGRWVRRALMVLGLGLVALRPWSAPASGGELTSNLDVYVAVDRTASMVAEDFGRDGQPRLDGVRADVLDLADDLVGARFAVLGYDNNVVDLMPLTDDQDALATTIDLLRPEMTEYSTGSSPRLPVEGLFRRLTQAAEDDPDRVRVVLLFTDGETTADESAATSFAPLGGLIAGGAVLGYGTEAGGQMREQGPIGGPPPPYLLDPATGQPARSRVDEDALRAIAEELDVPYLHRDAPGGLDDLAGDLRGAARRAATGGELTVRQDHTAWLALPVLLLTLVEVAAVAAAAGRLAGPRTRRAVAS